MSPKRKKVEAALKNLFSNPTAPKSDQTAASERDGETTQESNQTVEKAVEKAAAKPRRTRQKTVPAAKSKPVLKAEGAAEAVKKVEPEKPAPQVAEKAETKPVAVLDETPVQGEITPQTKTTTAAPIQNPTQEETGTTEKAKQTDQDRKSAQEPKKETKKLLDETQLVVFKLDDEYYGVKIELVESIIKMQPYTIVPHVPKYIVGVTNLRGYVLPIVDLRTRFDLPTREETHNTRVIVLLINGEKVGMIVDEVNEVARVLTDDIDPTPALIVNINMEFVDGIAKLREENSEAVRLAILLNLEKALKIK
jgi:purine-binding chemotaxis protein CheW